MANASAVWADYDGDSDQDLLVSGDTTPNHPALLLYENRNGMLTRTVHDLPALSYSQLHWSDMDSDGDLDIAVAGFHPIDLFRGYIVRNDGSAGFQTLPLSQLDGIGYHAMSVGDLDADGKSDLVVSGKPSPGMAVLRVLHNDGGMSFSAIPHYMEGVVDGSVHMASWNAEAGEDILIVGNNPEPSAIVATYETGQVQPRPTTLGKIAYGEARWGDYDNDGDQDVIMAGREGENIVTRIYRNQGASFGLVQPTSTLPQLYDAKVQWVDWNSDGFLDFLVGGLDNVDAPANLIYTYEPTSQTFIP